MADTLITTLFTELQAKVAICWPEVAVAGSSVSGTAHGIIATQDLDDVPFDFLTPPFAIIYIPRINRIRMRMDAPVWQAVVDIYWIRSKSETQANIYSKLKHLEAYLDDKTNDLSDDLGQIYYVEAIDPSSRSALNAAFAVRGMPFRGGCVSVLCWIWDSN